MKAAARPKAMAVLRRPAVRGVAGQGAPPGRGVRRRPAAREGERSPWEDGAELPLHLVPLDLFQPGSCLVVSEGDYYGAPVKLAGQILRVERDRNGAHILLRCTGTDSEQVLRTFTSAKDTPFRLHVCPEGCGRQESGDFYVHAVRGRQGRADGEEGWVNSLDGPATGGPDEMAGLRKREQELLQARHPQQGEAVEAPDGEGKDPAPEKKKKEKKKKSKEKAQEVLSGRQPSKAGRKELSSLYGGTALDPKERVRKTVLKKARRFAGKRKTKRSTSSSSKGSSDSSSTSESLGLGTEGVFAEETKARAISERYPGALTVETLLNMRRSLLTTSGEEGELKDTGPVALLYFRNVLTKKASGAQARELLTLSTTIDALLKGQPALALDVLCQRLKSQELVLGGTHWAVAQKIELAAGEAPALIARGELQTAQRENYLEARARWQTQSSSAKGAPKGKTKGKFDKDHPPREDRKEDARRDKGKGGEKK